jgi:predicted transcriptional regulator
MRALGTTGLVAGAANYNSGEDLHARYWHAAQRSAFGKKICLGRKPGQRKAKTKK